LIEFNCPTCGQKLGARDEPAGRKARCFACQEPVRVPGIPAKALMTRAPAANLSSRDMVSEITDANKSSGVVGWLRERWHAYRAARKLKEYQRRLSEWQAEADQLQEEIQLTQHANGLKGTSEVVPVVLHKGEGVFLVAQGAALVEPRRLPGHWVGGYSGISFRVMKGVRYHVRGSRGQYVPGSEVPTSIAIGTATVTSQRVVFQSGNEAREFAFSKLIGYQHDPQRPLTYFQVSNQKKASGIGYTQESARIWRFRLSLALAHFHGEVPALLEHLRRDSAEHQAAKPQVPADL
jgi:hypothetical protein